MTNKRRLIVFGLLIVAVASLWRATAVEREKHRIAAAYKEAQDLLNQIEQERTHLNTELSGARTTIETQEGSLDNLQQELSEVQTRLERTVSELSMLQEQYAKLQTENSSLNSQLSVVSSEKQQLEAKLSDIRELKLAIRDVKRKVWARRWEAWRARAASQREKDQEQLASGNRGYLVRGGAATLGSGPRMHVHVLEPEAR
ncbi:MAG: hypothetical protein COV75_05295 [Candidatus Omnitrophica bacterium CG11_big_fil_rev_8_21_14_0_20_63_9]|nr:MAG: hypothetical protein COV75_05295 [Candidatus Omnitrophica bacterium CG11_big_fil_rev_8_21_14_0_20_63_9]